MAIIESVSNIEPFFPGERPSHEKFTEQTSQKVNTMINNHIIINDSLGLLLQGVSGGAEQARLSFALATAPVGWTRDLTVTTDQLLRVTDGVTVPPGTSPQEVGGLGGGNWTITGTTSVAQSGHTHSMNNHSHPLAHTHPVSIFNNHNHPHRIHTHNIPTHAHIVPGLAPFSSGGVDGTIQPNTFFQSSPTSRISLNHTTHTVGSHTHTGTSGGAGPTAGNAGGEVTGSSAIPFSGSTPSSSDSNNDNSSTNTSHNHVPTHDGTWRPKYLNMIVCLKD